MRKRTVVQFLDVDGQPLFHIESPAPILVDPNADGENGKSRIMVGKDELTLYLPGHTYVEVEQTTESLEET